MYHSLQYVTFMSCNVVVLHRIILYCNIGRRVKDGVVHCSHQQLLIAKWLGLGMELFLFSVQSDKDICAALLAH